MSAAARPDVEQRQSIDCRLELRRRTQCRHDRLTPPSQRLIRLRSRRLPASVRGSSGPSSKLARLGQAVQSAA